MVWLSFLHYTSLCISCDKNLGEFLMLCFVLWALCCSFLSIKIYVCTWVDLLFVNSFRFEINIAKSNCVLQFQYSIHGTHKQMSASIICCMISSRLMCNLGLFLVYQDQQRPRNHEHHDALPKVGDGRSSKS